MIFKNNRPYKTQKSEITIWAKIARLSTESQMTVCLGIFHKKVMDDPELLRETIHNMMGIYFPSWLLLGYWDYCPEFPEPELLPISFS